MIPNESDIERDKERYRHPASNINLKVKWGIGQIVCEFPCIPASETGEPLEGRSQGRRRHPARAPSNFGEGSAHAEPSGGRSRWNWVGRPMPKLREGARLGIRVAISGRGPV